MNTQLNIKINQKLLKKAEEFAKEHGFLNIQDMIRHIIRDKVNGKDMFFSASMESFSKEWLSNEDEIAWEKFQ